MIIGMLGAMPLIQRIRENYPFLTLYSHSVGRIIGGVEYFYIPQLLFMYLWISSSSPETELQCFTALQHTIIK